MPAGSTSTAVSPATVASRIRVTGVVQGVGYRPFVWRLARDLSLTGWVRNDAVGVEIAAEGPADLVDALISRLRREAPPLARVDQVRAANVPLEGAGDFQIIDSGGGTVNTLIGADVGVCADCLRELFDPRSRRWRHAFITCTHCGPRYTVTRRLPYDRPQTSLAPFPLCPDCAGEYADPANRRFHAETVCCLNCGPRLSLRKVGAGGTAAVSGDVITATLAAINEGAIVAIKGLGGFHLACDATNAAAVASLRLRKDREAKPFAVMLANTASLDPHVDAGTQERELLESRARPIVLLPRREGNEQRLAGVAPGLDALGVMLPVTPLHYLLFHEAAGRPAGAGWLEQAQGLALVMTSANPGGEPIVRDDAEAEQRLGGIADYILGHDRDVVARCDDSVIRVVAGSPQFVRRSRGYVPDGIALPGDGPPVVAFGAHLKNTICVTRGAHAVISPHIGDLETAASCAFLDETVERMLDLLAVSPMVVAHDRHPDYYSTRAAVAFAQRLGVPALAVQHHHAHVAGVCAEHGLREPVLGLVLDGIGLGDDDGAWGGELLRVVGASFRRLGNIGTLALPGADRAAREPWRMAAAALHALGRGNEIETRFTPQVGAQGAATVATMLARNLHCPPSSSMGRLFDAAAGLLGFAGGQQFEAQAAMWLEQVAKRHIARHGWPQRSHGSDTASPVLDLLPLLNELSQATDAASAAARFHASLADALASWVQAMAQEQGLRVVALSGGCFFNQLLSQRLLDNLAASGLTVLRPRQSSPGDAGISLGQAWVALDSLRNDYVSCTTG